MKTTPEISTGANFLANLRRSFKILQPEDRTKLSLVTLIQVLFGFLDLLGVAIIGMVSALVVRGINAQEPGDRVGKLLEIMQIEEFDLRNQIIVLGIASLLVLTSKTIFSVIILRKTIYYLSRKSAAISNELISKLLNMPITYISQKPTQERLFALTTGVSNLTVGVFTNLVLIVSDSALLLILLTGLLIVDPSTSILTFGGFALVGFTLFHLLSTHASRMGRESSLLIVKSNKQITEVIESFRETTVKNSKWFYSRRIKNVKEELAEIDAEIKFLPNISKYVTELSIVIGITAISAFQFSKSDPNNAAAVLVVFMAASTRIAPALMRLQQNAISLKTYLAAAEPTLVLADDLESVEKLAPTKEIFQDSHSNFSAEIILTDVEFSYPDAEGVAVKGVDLSLQHGTITALVGPSGGGKSTIVDLILGILEPTKGRITISGTHPAEVLNTWPGSIGYVPQRIFLSNGSIAENVCLGFDVENVPENAIWEALDSAEIGDFVRATREKLQFNVGEAGCNLSGGQRQRIGIARALLTKPKFVVLDEATSALDSETEDKVAHSINSLKGKCTLLIVAHRLSTVRLADQVCYVEDGLIKNKGSFEEMKSVNPRFKTQAGLLGL